MLIPDPPGTFRFGDFELDAGAYELRRNGHPVRIERQPMDLLLLLVERRRQLVQRSEIVDRLWGKDVFVDVETGVHTAIRKIRRALHRFARCPNLRGDGSRQRLSLHRNGRGGWSAARRDRV